MDLLDLEVVLPSLLLDEDLAKFLLLVEVNQEDVFGKAFYLFVIPRDYAQHDRDVLSDFFLLV